MGNIYRHGGKVDKIVQIRLSDLYNLIDAELQAEHNTGEITITNPHRTTMEIIGRIEEKAKTVVTITLET